MWCEKHHINQRFAPQGRTVVVTQSHRPRRDSVVFLDDCHSLALPVSFPEGGRARPSVTVRNSIQTE